MEQLIHTAEGIIKSTDEFAPGEWVTRTDGGSFWNGYRYGSVNEQDCERFKRNPQSLHVCIQPGGSSTENCFHMPRFGLKVVNNLSLEELTQGRRW